MNKTEILDAIGTRIPISNSGPFGTGFEIHLDPDKLAAYLEGLEEKIERKQSNTKGFDKNCPFCTGAPWGASPEALAELKAEHEKNHLTT